MRLDLQRFGPAVLLDANGGVVEANDEGRRWLRDDGTAPVAPNELTRPGRGYASRWVERRDPQDGALTRAVVTAVSQPEGGALLLFTDAIEAREDIEPRVGAVLDSVPAMIGYWDHDQRNRFANRAYVEWFGMTPEQMRGRHIRELLGPDIYAKNLPYIEAALRGEVQRFERAIPRPDGGGTRHSSATYVPDVVDGAVRGFCVLVADVTDLKTAEAALRAVHAELEARVEERTAALSETNRELARSNAELEQFAHVASHDLQEPLRMVASYAELLGERYRGQLDARADKYIFYAVDGARRMQRLVADLLAYSRVGSQGKPLLPVDSGAALRSVLHVMAGAIRAAGASVEATALPLVSADEGQLQQLFQNVIGNAIKFRGEAPPLVRVDAKLAEGRWVFAVRDNGIGIEARYAERIFQMFQRLHERGKYEGSGIGLAVARRILERHGGQIWFESEPGVGTTFYFTLPPAPAGEAP